MSKPIVAGTELFTQTQTIETEVVVSDTMLTTLSRGMLYYPATALDNFGVGIDLDTADQSSLLTHFAANTVPGLTDTNGNGVFGRIPIIYDYWGTGTPIGVSIPNRVTFRVKGYVKTTGTYAMVLLGTGHARVFHEGSPVPLISKETQAEGQRLPVNIAFRDYTAGDEIEIFYWGINEHWGGWTIRVTDNTAILDSQLLIDWSVLREEPIMSATWMDDGDDVTSTSLEDVVRTTVDCRDGQIRTANVVLALTTAGDPNGWYFDAQNTTIIHNDSAIVIKQGYHIVVKNSVNDGEYTDFTGFINDIVPQDDQVTLNCVGFEQRCVRQVSENFPDRLSYSAFGYINKDGVSEPVYPIPAYDNWPYEHAIKDMAWRAWIDPILFEGKKRLLRYTQTVEEDGASLFLCRSLSGQLMRIPRQPHYGNVSGNPGLPPDDEYLTTSEATQSLQQRINSLAERIGYKFGTDHNGYVVLRPVNTPVAVVPLIDLATTGITFNPSAIGGKYRLITGIGWTVSQTNIKAARIELVVSLAPSLGSVRVRVTRQEDSTLVTDVVVSLAKATEIFYYDGVVDSDGANICSIPVLEGAPYGTYTVLIEPSGGGGGTQYRLNSLRVYEQDPSVPSAPFSLRTFENTLSIDVRSNSTQRINDAIVTGTRRATLTDSDKTKDALGSEFIVRRAQDIHSILNPAAVNYMGGRITAIYSDNAIADHDLAEWTATTLVSRYRAPRPDVVVEHTALPVLEIGDPLYVKDDSLDTVDGSVVMYVTGFSTVYDNQAATATTSFEATAFAKPPSYEPPEEVDISVYNNKPAINLNITYTSLTDTSQVNPTKDIVELVQSSDYIREPVTVQLSAGDYFVTVPADTWSPGSDYMWFDENPAVPRSGFAVKNYPYYTFYRRTSSTRLDLVFEGGDGSATYKVPGWDITAGSDAIVGYIKMSDAYSGDSPFYDPYTSDLNPPNLVHIEFDTLVTGYYRVSVVDARNRDRETIVAWLSEPTNTDPSGTKHWTFMTPGTKREFRWDGVDTIGSWNKQQSENYVSRFKNAFPEVAERFKIGAGAYAHNDETTAPAFISFETDGGEVVYPVGKYAQFFIKIECMRIAADGILTVKSINGADTKDVPTDLSDLYDSSATELDARFIYYHLPPDPNRVRVDVEDWDGASDYDPQNPQDDWVTSEDLHATFREGKPIRLVITPQVRKGAMFAGNAANTTTKIHRVVHLTAVGMDSSVVYYGTRWNSAGSAEEKRVISRRTVNDEHTIVYADQTFTRGDEVEPWVFYPSLFEDDFGNGEEEIRYLDYLQLFDIPHWNPSRRINEKRSRFVLGYLAYLFYFSIYTQDKSGRLAWAIDDTHVDKSKILENTDEMDWPYDLTRHQRRVIYTRQWWDTDILDTRLDQFSVPDKYKGIFSDRFDLRDTDNTRALYPLNNGTNVTGRLTGSYVDDYTAYHITQTTLPASVDSSRLFGDTGSTTELGDWTFETDGSFQFIPNPSRDFHPFYLVPPMGIASREYMTGNRWTSYWERNYIYAHTETNSVPAHTDADEAKFDTWFAIIRSQEQTATDYYSGRNVAGIYVDKNDNPTTVPTYIAEHQRIDDIIRYEDSRGGFSHGTYPARDLVIVAGGDPYYLNPIMYRYFRKHQLHKNQYANDVHEQGWFSLTFRHTYVWESATLFPTTGEHRNLAPERIDTDLTLWSERGDRFDPGAWAGWKDDHPSALTPAGAFHETTNDCASLHWRYDSLKLGVTNFGYMGGTCNIDDGNELSTFEDFVVSSYVADENIFWWGRFHKFLMLHKIPPIAVGPRLPETRRVLFALILLNNRRTAQLSL